MGIETALIAGSIASGAMGARSARKAAKTQAEAANAANQTELEMYNQSRADLEPWRVAGQNALEQLMRMQGFRKVETPRSEDDQPEGPGYTWERGGDPMAELQLDPGYLFRQREGQNALARMMAARGMRNSGAALREAARYNQGLASQEFADAYNRLAGLSGTGQTTSNQLAALGSNYASQYGQNLGQAANARASGYVASGQARQNALSDLMGYGLMKFGR